jgi:hypothetical protein
MRYYCTDTDKIEFITEDFTKTTYSTVLADNRNIPLENCILLDGQLYDNRELEYWKLAKTKENQVSAYMKSVAGVTVNGIKIKTTAESVTALNELLSLATLENNAKSPVEFRDYNDEWQSVTVEQFKVICLQVGQYCRRIDKTYTTNIKLINQAKTIAEIQSIVI